MTAGAPEPATGMIPAARDLIASIAGHLPGLAGLDLGDATRNAREAMYEDQRRREEWQQAYLDDPTG
jgi:hypothetical protein